MRQRLFLALILGLVATGAAHARAGVGDNPKSVIIRGRIVRPVPHGDTASLGDHDIYLLHLDTHYTVHSRTASDGGFRFTNLNTEGLYYLVVVSRMRVQDGYTTEYRYGWDAWSQSYGYVPVTVPKYVESNLSWHQAITPPAAGSFILDLSGANADPEFCADLQPTHDPVTRTPFRSWRRADLVPGRDE